ncbi:ferredoxin [Micromonospora sp. DT48]|uniref:ferredoxin n=1 Tax=unclassified Micromonospora TaxID=2617518 RepID=UPI0012BB871D|nr:ferredoxin [Micromonospora sp. CP22]MTK01480.1 ferredoxin [Micromonospora sp. CP22]
MRVRVDTDQCDSTGLCAQIAPEIFALDADDVLVVRTPTLDPPQLPAAEEAVRACPKLAIELVER